MSSIPSSPRGVACLVLTDSAADKRGNNSSERKRDQNIQEKRVRFFETNTTNVHVDDNGTRIVFYKNGSCETNNSRSQTKENNLTCSFGPIRPELSVKERELLYYSKQDFAVFKEEAKLLAQSTDGSKGCRMYAQLFLDVYKGPSAEAAAASCHPVEMMESHPNHNDEENDHDNNRDDVGGALVDRYNTTVLPLATAPVRGVERYAFPQLALDQKRVQECVLRCHKNLPKSMDREAKARILAATSSRLSRPARHLARVLGHADSIYALSIYKRTFLSTAKSTKTTKSNDAGSSDRRSRSKKNSTKKKKKSHT